MAEGDAYVESADLIARLNNVTGQSTEIDRARHTASRWIEQYCSRHFWQTATAVARTFDTCDPYCLHLGAFNDLVSITSLKTDEDSDGVYETTWSASDYQLLPTNPSAAPEQRPYTEIKAIGSRAFPLRYYDRTRAGRIQVTGVFGWPSIPYDIQQAALTLGVDLFKLKDSPFGVQGFGEFGQIRVGTNRVVTTLVDPYRLPGFA